MIVGGVLVALLALSVFGLRMSVTRDVDLELTADRGLTRVSLADDAPDATSPACGCYDPAFGAQYPGEAALHWHGFGVPSVGFDLDARLESPASDMDGWALTAFVPKTDAINWLAVPDDHSVDITVVAERGETRTTVFHERASHLLVFTRRPIAVAHGEENPYAALLPASGGTTTVRSEEGSRPTFGGILAISTTSPERDAADTAIDAGDYSQNTEATQRGPMIDLIGPSVTFLVEPHDGLKVLAAFDLIDGIADADFVEITVRTPFSLRLLAHPANRAWKSDFPDRAWAGHQEVLRQSPTGDEELQWGPRLQGRYVDTGPLPAYTVHLDRVQVPEAPRWARMVARSVKGSIEPMLDPAPVDESRGWTGLFELPPVTETRQVAVFGSITEYQSDAVRGRVLVGSDARSVARGQDFELTSRGIAAGRYRLSPLVSAGEPTEVALVAGDATIKIDGRPVTQIPYLRALIILLGTAILGVLIGELFAWGRARLAHPQRVEPTPGE